MATRQARIIPTPAAEAPTIPIPTEPMPPPEAGERPQTGVGTLGDHSVRFWVNGAAQKVVYHPDADRGKILP